MSHFATRVALEHYGWGTLRTVELENRYRCVIHPEHWGRIARVLGGYVQAATFKDEQGLTWRVTIENLNMHPSPEGRVPALVFRAGSRCLKVHGELLEHLMRGEEV